MVLLLFKVELRSPLGFSFLLLPTMYLGMLVKDGMFGVVFLLLRMVDFMFGMTFFVLRFAYFVFGLT